MRFTLYAVFTINLCSNRRNENMTENTQVLLKSTPTGIPEVGHFEISKGEVPSIGKGQVLLKVEWLSLDPYMRGQIAGRHLSGRVAPGDLLRGETVGEVVATESAKFKVGDRVTGFGGWQEYACLEEDELVKVRDDIERPSYALSALGMPGLTAYAGLIWKAQIKEGDTVLIPAAIGAVGSTAAQLAKNKGCKIIGVSSNPSKIKYAIEELGYDACLDRLDANVEAQLKKIAPDGVDVYFDLVGGEMLDIASRNLAIGARVLLCGLMADYNNENKTPGPYPGAWIGARAHIFGLVVYDYLVRRDEFLDAVMPMIASGKMTVLEDISKGIEQAPEAFCKLMRGENEGKSLVQVSQG